MVKEDDDDDDDDGDGDDDDNDNEWQFFKYIKHGASKWHKKLAQNTSKQKIRGRWDLFQTYLLIHSKSWLRNNLNF